LKNWKKIKGGEEMKFIRKYLWAFYLGFSLSVFTDLTPLNWQFYAIGLPVTILVATKKQGGTQWMR